MKILVPAKRVPDPNSTIKVKPDGSGIVTEGLKWVINPFDEIAIEEALRIKEKLGGADVVLVGIGSKVLLRAAAHRTRDGRGPRDPRRHRRCARLLGGRPGAPQARHGREGGPRADGQTGDRRRLEPSRPDARRSARLATRHVRLEGGAGRRPEERTGDARGRRRPRGPLHAVAGGDHGGPATQRAALRVAARHHEGPQERVEGDPARRPRRRYRLRASRCSSWRRRRSARAAARSRAFRSSSKLLHSEAKVI